MDNNEEKTDFQNRKEEIDQEVEANVKTTIFTQRLTFLFFVAASAAISMSIVRIFFPASNDDEPSSQWCSILSWYTAMLMATGILWLYEDSHKRLLLRREKILHSQDHKDNYADLRGKNDP